ncbi:MAG: energy-coupling factor ABC transporter permease [Chromatiaceae bacterium]|jgi:uncharacterized membrane protein
MAVDSALFPLGFNWMINILYGAALVGAVRMAPWRKLRNPEQLHVFLGAVVVLLILWHMRATVQPGLSFHLLGVTAVTLMFGWSLAVIAASLALFGVSLNVGHDWAGFAINAMVTGVVPITLTQILLILIRWYLPKQFFVYVLVNGFLTAGFVALVSGYLVTWLLVLSGAYTFAELAQTFLPFFPLMFLPEAILNGWVMAVLVAFRPNWVYSFSDEQYLKGK